jgi:hypothetical protein
MIDVGYLLTDPAVLAGWEHHHDVATADEADLLWSGFRGTISITTADGQIAPPFDWVPLLHFARSMILVVDQLTEPGSTAEYTFTESSHELQFERSRELVTISATFTDTVVTTTMPDLSDAVRRCARALLDDLIARFPRLADNPLSASLSTALDQRL